MGLKEVFKKVSAIEPEITELSNHKVDLAVMDDINKLKQTIISEWKSHVSKRDAWGAESSKILQSIGQHESKGVQLKKEVDVIDKKILDLSSQLTKLRNQAQSLGLELPREVNLLDGVQIGAWSNKMVDTREIVDEFTNKLK
jgi:uncharacterized coiled-coil DUF342 family protein